jgi:hypothetical protein
VIGVEAEVVVVGVVMTEAVAVVVVGVVTERTAMVSVTTVMSVMVMLVTESCHACSVCARATAASRCRDAGHNDYDRNHGTYRDDPKQCVVQGYLLAVDSPTMHQYNTTNISKKQGKTRLAA